MFGMQTKTGTNGANIFFCDHISCFRIFHNIKRSGKVFTFFLFFGKRVINYTNCFFNFTILALDTFVSFNLSVCKRSNFAISLRPASVI